MTDTHRLTGVVGCGLIGASWAGLFIASGRDVFAWDPMDAVRADFAGRVDTTMAQIAATGLFPNTLPGTLRIVTSIEAVAENATLIQENAPENAPLKRGLYAAIERAGRDDLIIASSTSNGRKPTEYKSLIALRRTIRNRSARSWPRRVISVDLPTPGWPMRNAL